MTKLLLLLIISMFITTLTWADSYVIVVPDELEAVLQDETDRDDSTDTKAERLQEHVIGYLRERNGHFQQARTKSRGKAIDRVLREDENKRPALEALLGPLD